MEKWQIIYTESSRMRFKKCKGFIYKPVAEDSKGEKVLHKNYSFKIQKVQRIDIKTSHLRFKRGKGFT